MANNQVSACAQIGASRLPGRSLAPLYLTMPGPLLGAKVRPGNTVIFSLDLFLLLGSFVVGGDVSCGYGVIYFQSV